MRLLPLLLVLLATAAGSVTSSSSTIGTGTATGPGTGTAAGPGTGTAAGPGTGTAAGPGTGTAADPTTGTAAGPGTGTAAGPGTGTAASPTTGTAAGPTTATATASTASAPTSPWFPPSSSTGSRFPTGSWWSSTGSSGGQPDQGTYWPWNTPRGVLPTCPPSSSLNPSGRTDVYHVIFQTLTRSSPASNMTVTVPYPGYLSDSFVTANHNYYHAIFTDFASANTWFNTLYAHNAAFIVRGSVYSTLGSINISRLLLRYSYLVTSNVIPTSLSSSYITTNYYVTARSSRGEFRMLAYTSNSQVEIYSAYQAIIQEYDDNTTTPQRTWDTVKVYANGNEWYSSSTSRGSELEHLGAFQWLSLPAPTNRFINTYTYYMLVSFTSLSGVKLERMHTYSYYSSALTAQQWVSWYTNAYEPYYYRASVMIYYRQQLYSSSVQPNFYSYQLTQHFNWITQSPSTPYPYYPTPYPSYPTPYPYPPYYPYYPRTSTSWSDLTTAQMAFIIAYPSSLVVAAVLMLLIVRCCLKRRYDNLATPTPVPPCLHRVTCLMMLLSVASFVLLIVSMSLKRFSNAWLSYTGASFASYGPFQVDQSKDYSDWLPLRKNAEVMSPVTGACMIISMIASGALIGHVKTHMMTFRVVFLTLVAFLFSLCATLVWIPVHVRLQDHSLDSSARQSDYNPGYFTSQPLGTSIRYDSYGGMLLRSMGAGYILLMTATGFHFLIFILCVIIHKKYATTISTQGPQELEGLQLVAPTSPYYYRDVPTGTNPPAVMALPVPAYMYGVPRPTAPSTAPPPFMFAAVPASGYPYAAPMYYPPPPAPVGEPLHQPISAPAQYTAPAPAPTPTTTVAAAYPSLPVEVPASGPNTEYQRL